ncbi:MAG: hypothetical protein VXZ24_12130 [Pseudomonadota bacterium]|nr:hypothetical protein [Pseudomonadota bacterium]
MKRNILTKIGLTKTGLTKLAALAPIATVATIALTMALPASAGSHKDEFHAQHKSSATSFWKKRRAGYEVWASDQSNSVPGVASRGIEGSWIWVWDSKDVKRQLKGGPDAVSLPCGPDMLNPTATGPCNLLDVFPGTLEEYDAEGQPTGNTLADLNGFGRLHGMLPDPQQRYLNANIFAPSGGYVGIIDRQTKAAVGLFRVTGTNVAGNDTRSVHMSFWSEDGNAILIANLHGKVLERINVERNRKGRITNLSFDRSASLGVGKNMEVTSSATVFKGANAWGWPLKGDITGDYVDAAFADLTPNGVCKENGCTDGADGALGGRPNNVIICPVASSNENVYVTLGGGGLIVADHSTTPMSIVGEYGNQAVNGAGCGGVEANGQMFVNAGVSASGAGATQSVFTMYSIDDAAFSTPQSENSPMPVTLFKDSTNTSTGGNMDGAISANNSGQLPGITTRRDAHGADATLDERYVHNVDRIQNTVEVFDTVTHARTTYDLTSADGQGNGDGPCLAASVGDDIDLPANDPAPDLMEITPDGRYFMVALRGPTPVSVTHSAQGSCPGVGIVEITQGGQSGRLVGVLRSTNTVDTAPVSAAGGHAYTGAERSDPHAATVIAKKPVRIR